MTTQRQIVSLYRSLLREAYKMPGYNFRHYAVRKIRDSFRESSQLKDQDVINKLFIEGKKDLEVLKRQVIIGGLYDTEKLVIEQMQQ